MKEEKELVKELREHCERLGSQKDFANRNEFSPAYITDVLLGRRPVSERLAEALGYKRIIRFVKEE